MFSNKRRHTVANRKQWPTSSARRLLDEPGSPPEDLKTISQRRVPRSGNTLCDGHRRKRIKEVMPIVNYNWLNVSIYFLANNALRAQFWYNPFLVFWRAEVPGWPAARATGARGARAGAMASNVARAECGRSAGDAAGHWQDDSQGMLQPLDFTLQHR